MQSPLYKANEGYLPICKTCADEIYQQYREAMHDDKLAMRRVCMKFDVYWNEKIWDVVVRSSSAGTRVSGYITKSNLQQYNGKTFDDTLDEEFAARLTASGGTYVVKKDTALGEGGNEDGTVEEEDFELTQEIVDFWGGGLDPLFYRELEHRRQYWCGGREDEMDLGELAVIKQICVLEVTINRDVAEGKAVDRNMNTLNTLLGSANLKPVQKKDVADGVSESTPFGVWIRKIENERPISEPDPEFQDVDGIIKYITVWFLGHLCKMLKIKNKYAALYEEEMARLRVDRPEYEGEDEEEVLEDIFERAEAASEEGGEALDQFQGG